ncbi:MAG TPA: mechanosensitive ion channel family protein [Candidatus Margulisiibacteriota bacterium]|nr:mechanosensitive ion channel family protein [Candidatus Margulisiibacteriota bacterium]
MAWFYELTSHPILSSSLYVLLALGCVVLRQLVHLTRLGRSLDASFTLIICGLAVGTIGLVTTGANWVALAPYFNAVLFGTVAIGVVRILLTLFVDFYLQQRGGAAVSAIFRDVASVIAYFLVIVVVLRSTLDINLASLVATSAVLTVIVGLALQDVLSNLFSGLVLELEAPFSRGDWVRIGAFEGKVEETGWRTTKLRTRVNELVTLPNAMLSKEALVNYSRPDPSFGDTLHFEAAYEAPPNVVKDAVLSVLDADTAVLRVPRAEVWLTKYGESGVAYTVRYWITDFNNLERIRNRIMSNLWYALRRANVRIPFPARDLFIYQGSAPQLLAAERPDTVAMLRGVPLLAPLDDAALGRLATRVRRVIFGAGEFVVRENEPGDSFYVIERGAAEVMVGTDGAARMVGRLQTADVFGEMSLLAGEPRSATVRAATDLSVLVVDREAFKEIISTDPAILDPLSMIAARRQAEQQEHRRSLASMPSVDVDHQQAQRLRERIKAFFRL